MYQLGLGLKARALAQLYLAQASQNHRPGLGLGHGLSAKNRYRFYFEAIQFFLVVRLLIHDNSIFIHSSINSFNSLNLCF